MIQQYVLDMDYVQVQILAPVSLVTLDKFVKDPSAMVFNPIIHLLAPQEVLVLHLITAHAKMDM
jgi:hypothetical protein